MNFVNLCFDECLFELQFDSETKYRNVTIFPTLGIEKVTIAEDLGFKRWGCGAS